MKKVLITGVAGFVGSNLAKELLARDYQVYGIDNYSQGFKRNIQDLFSNPSFKFYEGDVCDKDFCAKAVGDVEGVFHLAAFKIPRYGGALDTLHINTRGTENILEAARKNKCKVVFASTSDIYGKNPDIPFNEGSDLVLGQTNIKRWSYAVSKIFDEHLCYAYQEKYGLPVTIVRYFGGYGPNQNITWRGGPQSVFIECALGKKPIPIHGNGKQRRSFTYISDIINGTILAMEKDKTIGEAFNIGNDREIEIIGLAEMIWRMVNPDIEPRIEFIEYASFSGKYEDVQRRIPDITKSKQFLGFEASVGLEDGLPLAIAWQRRITSEEKGS